MTLHCEKSWGAFTPFIIQEEMTKLVGGSPRFGDLSCSVLVWAIRETILLCAVSNMRMYMISNWNATINTFNHKKIKIGISSKALRARQTDVWANKILHPNPNWFAKIILDRQSYIRLLMIELLDSNDMMIDPIIIIKWVLKFISYMFSALGKIH